MVPSFLSEIGYVLPTSLKSCFGRFVLKIAKTLNVPCEARYHLVFWYENSECYLFPFQLVFSSLHHGDVQNGIENYQKNPSGDTTCATAFRCWKIALTNKNEATHFVRSVKSQVSCV